MREERKYVSAHSNDLDGTEYSGTFLAGCCRFVDIRRWFSNGGQLKTKWCAFEGFQVQVH